MPTARARDARRDVRVHGGPASRSGGRHGRPGYVVDIDAAANRVVVGPQELLSRRGLVADRVSWVAGARPIDGPFEAAVRIRYRGDDVPAVDRAVRRRPAPCGVPQPAACGGPGPERGRLLGDELLGGGRILEALR